MMLHMCGTALCISSSISNIYMTAVARYCSPFGQLCNGTRHMHALGYLSPARSALKHTGSRSIWTRQSFILTPPLPLLDS